MSARAGEGGPRPLEGKVVIVTGASAGIGAATALRLGREGARVVLAARRHPRLELLRSEIAVRGGLGLALEVDVTLAADRERLVREALAEFGRIDGLVNNAGYGQRGPLETVPLEAVRRNFETNVFAPLALAQLVLPGMRASRAGRIVNVSSVAGRIVWPFSAVYGATKHALEALSDGLRIEVAPFGIQVVVVEPGFVETEFADVARETSRPVTEAAGPYAARVGRAGRRLELAKRTAARPEDIASLISTALSAPHPRTRYAAPLYARAALLARRLLPQRIVDGLLTAGRG